LVDLDPVLITFFEILQMKEINSLMRTCKNLQNHFKLNSYKEAKIAKIQEKIIGKYYNFRARTHNGNIILKDPAINATFTNSIRNYDWNDLNKNDPKVLE